MTLDASAWTITGDPFARLSVGATSGIVDFARPSDGLSQVAAGGFAFDPQSTRLLAITPQADPPTWRAQLVDRYVRGNDLVATYSGDDAWPYAPQIYWSAEPRAAGGAALGGLSIVVSIQTNLLDTHPRVFVRSGLAAAEMLLVRTSGSDALVETADEGYLSPDSQSASTAIVWRLPGGTLSYAELMPASDFCQVEIRHGPTQAACWELFSEFLEKGVIRRARIQSLFLPREKDVELVAEGCRALEKRPLPLTT